MKLFMNKLSPNVQRVRLTAAVLGMKLEEVALDFTKGEHKSPEYLAINPNGAVPTLVDDKFVLTESRAIMQYLAAKQPESGLLPRDEQARADVTRWQFWDALQLWARWCFSECSSRCSAWANRTRRRSRKPSATSAVLVRC